MSQLTTLPAAPGIGEAAARPDDLIWRLGVEQYHAMVRAGILGDDDPVELLDGWLVYKMPKNPPHRAVTRLVQDALARIVPAEWYVDAQEPITLPDSEPEPGVMVIRGQTRQYLDRHPGPRDVALVVEVSDATLQRDQELKKHVYARADIPVYWIVNLVENQIEVYSGPSGPAAQPAYRQQQRYRPAESVPVVIEGHPAGQIAAGELLP